MNEILEALRAYPAFVFLCHVLLWLQVGAFILSGAIMVIWPRAGRDGLTEILSSNTKRHGLVAFSLITSLGLIGASPDLQVPRTAMRLAFIFLTLTVVLAIPGIVRMRRTPGPFLPRAELFPLFGLLLSGIGAFLLWALDGQF